MKITFEEIEEIIGNLQSGYWVQRQTMGNERLAFLLVMVIITKKSVSSTVKILKSQFQRQGEKCVFRGITPRSKKAYQINLPLIFMDYLENYCCRFRISEENYLFPLNTQYVTKRFRELSQKLGYDITIRNLQMWIQDAFSSDEYQRTVYNLVNLLREIPLPEQYICFASARICNLISEIKIHLVRE